MANNIDKIERTDRIARKVLGYICLGGGYIITFIMAWFIHLGFETIVPMSPLGLVLYGPPMLAGIIYYITINRYIVAKALPGTIINTTQLTLFITLICLVIFKIIQYI